MNVTFRLSFQFPKTIPLLLSFPKISPVFILVFFGTSWGTP